MEILKNLANKLNISESEIKEKFELKEDAKTTEILNALGVYAIFENKQNLEDYLNLKISNKQKEIENLTAKISELTLSNEELTKNLNTFENKNETNTKTLKNFLSAEWNKLGIKRDFEKSGLNIDEVDFNNLPQYLLNFADKEGYSIKTQNNNEYFNSLDNKSDLLNFNGIIKK